MPDSERPALSRFELCSACFSIFSVLVGDLLDVESEIPEERPRLRAVRGRGDPDR